MMNTNSLIAYNQDVRPSLSKRQKAVLDQIIMRPGRTAKEYAKLMGVDHNTISGRFGELEKKGMIMEVGTIYINSRPNAQWQIIRKSEQLKLFNQ
jgi:DNA-binding MarR family transcriptional regulator